MSDLHCCVFIAKPYGKSGRALLTGPITRHVFKYRRNRKTLKELSVDPKSLGISEFGFSMLKAIEILDHVMKDPPYHTALLECSDDMLLESVLREMGDSYHSDSFRWPSELDEVDKIKFVLELYIFLRFDTSPKDNVGDVLDSVSDFGFYGFGLPKHNVLSMAVIFMILAQFWIVIDMVNKQGFPQILAS